MNSRPNLTPEQAMALLEAVIRDAPPLEFEQSLTDADLKWLGRAEAIIAAVSPIGISSELLDFRAARSLLGSYSHNRQALLAPLHTAYHHMELTAPQAAQGAFIPAGDTWNGYAALVKLMQRECDDLLLVDPYLSATLFTDFAPHSVAKAGVRCLTLKRREYHPALLAAAQRWSNDEIGKAKPVEVRYASAGALHDRLLIFDRAEAWLISQSLKDIAQRSPASVSRAEAELADLKAAHYDALWEQSEPLI